MNLHRPISDFPCLEDIIKFYKINNERLEVKIWNKSNFYQYVLVSQVVYIYNEIGHLVQSIMI